MAIVSKRKNPKVAVIGFGVTGKSVARFLISRGIETHVYESKRQQDFPETELKKFSEAIFHFETNNFDPKEYDYLVTSPGASLEIPPIQKALALNIPVHNDLTLFIEAWRKIGKIVGITGSNGKTTTASVLYEALKRLTPTILAGNIGNSPLDLLDIHYSKDVVAVLEISSNQLDLFKPEHYLDIYVLTNLSSNHLDRYHGDMDEYALSKLRGINKTKTKTIICADDSGTQKHILKKLRCDDLFVISFKTSPEQATLPGIYLDPRQGLMCKMDARSRPKPVFNRSDERALLGLHNLYNISFVLLSIKLLGLEISAPAIKAIRNFTPLEHRVEKVCQKKGVLYVNDSKSTSPDSIRVALETVGQTKNVILIAGGDDKNMSFDFLTEVFSEKVKDLIILPGEIAPKLKKVASSAKGVTVREVTTLAEATNLAAGKAVSGDVVLLSPGSYSRNYFKDYKERGAKFKEFVRDL
ncbi:MAG TPA: UDP-N-acetylmuramoyl-L-alanine--D-glutamate ligase [Candidatus Paceibacterota bacterium]|nr:UDP-N-acetylmuramoyl-L-alanine--D-glutamate ligase [Candidatus Paceibacterota bacterium]HRZ34427.1 UDP-N-acetylmuramoyl-L-alanine--D-glutamate ligase [Candidatus Paceibacterota bacterium]